MPRIAIANQTTAATSVDYVNFNENRKQFSDTIGKLVFIRTGTFGAAGDITVQQKLADDTYIDYDPAGGATPLTLTDAVERVVVDQPGVFRLNKIISTTVAGANVVTNEIP